LISNQFVGVARGMGRSYGDAAFAETTVDMRSLNHLLRFDRTAGIVECQAGVTLHHLLKIIVPCGWFLPVTPGTRFVTIGGAIASDVHGKNHHLAGCLSDHLTYLDVLTGSGDVIRCSRTENKELFRVSCGGMGLTGVITGAGLQLIPITNAYIEQQAINATNLEEIISLLDEQTNSPYSVAWIDTVNRSRNGIGRGRVYFGQHSEDPSLPLQCGSDNQIEIPAVLPGVINRLSTSLFNRLYQARQQVRVSHSLVHYQQYFYPLDAIRSWNRLYGKRGLFQYQFVIPKTAGHPPLFDLIQSIINSGLASPLVVLKAMGKANNNLLSFPVEGYTFAVDFAQSPASLALMSRLDDKLKEYGGRLYLTKDARMTADLFKKTYENLDDFMKIRDAFGGQKFTSHQALRLGIGS